MTSQDGCRSLPRVVDGKTVAGFPKTFVEFRRLRQELNVKGSTIEIVTFRREGTLWADRIINLAAG